MPLIRAVARWIGRRTEVSEPYIPSRPIGHTGGWNTDTGAIVWFVVVLIALPLVALLVLVGLVYEAIIRLDRGRRLADPIHWAIARQLPWWRLQASVH
jgi:hypothetical protein